MAQSVPVHINSNSLGIPMWCEACMPIYIILSWASTVRWESGDRVREFIDLIKNIFNESHFENDKDVS